MVNAVLAAFYHVTSSDKKPNHFLCPAGEDSWCGWQRDPSTYKHKRCLLETIINLLEAIFEDLSKPELLAKCLHGKTQNPNESLK